MICASATFLNDSGLGSGTSSGARPTVERMPVLCFCSLFKEVFDLGLEGLKSHAFRQRFDLNLVLEELEKGVHGIGEVLSGLLLVSVIPRQQDPAIRVLTLEGVLELKVIVLDVGFHAAYLPHQLLLILVILLNDIIDRCSVALIMLLLLLAVVAQDRQLIFLEHRAIVIGGLFGSGR